MSKRVWLIVEDELENALAQYRLECLGKGTSMELTTEFCIAVRHFLGSDSGKRLEIRQPVVPEPEVTIAGGRRADRQP